MTRNALTQRLDIRLTRRDSDLLDEMAKAYRCDRSDVIRRALAEFLARCSYLTQEEKKALGLTAPLAGPSRPD